MGRWHRVAPDDWGIRWSPLTGTRQDKVPQLTAQHIVEAKVDQWPKGTKTGIRLQIQGLRQYHCCFRFQQPLLSQLQIADCTLPSFWDPASNHLAWAGQSALLWGYWSKSRTPRFTTPEKRELEVTEKLQFTKDSWAECGSKAQVLEGKHVLVPLFFTSWGWIHDPVLSR
jgi:hypothetical protein